MLKRRSQPSSEAQDRSDETARQIGRLLRETREARGEELGDVAEFLRIRPGYLAALEAGELAAIPGRPYAIGFLRATGATSASTATGSSAGSRPRSTGPSPLLS
jgi:cytoskeleton protein RodZ